MIDNLTNEELLLYFGTFEKPRNLTEVARAFYENEGKIASVRSSLSGKDADEELMEKGLVEANKDGAWRYKAKSSELSEVLAYLLKTEGGEKRMPRFSNIDQEKETLQEMFSSGNMQKFFNKDNIKEFIPEKLSEVKESVAFYVKSLTLIMGSNRKIMEEYSESGKALTISRSQIQRIQSFLDLVMGIYEDELSEFKSLFKVLKRVAPHVNMKEIPVLRYQTPIDRYTSLLDQVLDSLSGGDVDDKSDFFQTPEGNVNSYSDEVVT